MTQRFAGWSGALLGAVWLGVPSSALATVVWTSDFETGDLTDWMPGVNNEGNVEVLGEQIYMGAFAGKITVHPEDTFTFDQNRVDIQHQSTLTNDGDDLWLSGFYLLPVDAQVRNNLGFFESNESFQNVMDFWVEPKQGGGTLLVFGVGFLGDTVLWTGDFTAGVWHQIAIHVHWSTDPQVGRVDFWLDGVQVVTDEAARTKADGNTLFFQTGMHRSEVGEFTETVYIDNFIEADTLAEAQIMAPVAAGGAGGAGGMAGASGAGALAGGGGMGGMVAGGAAGMPSMGGVAGMQTSAGAAGTMGSGAGGAAGAIPMSMAGTTAGLAGAPAGGSAATPASSTSSSSSGCAQSSGASPSGFGLVSLAVIGALSLLRRTRRK